MEVAIANTEMTMDWTTPILRNIWLRMFTDFEAIVLCSLRMSCKAFRNLIDCDPYLRNVATARFQWVSGSAGFGPAIFGSVGYIPSVIRTLTPCQAFGLMKKTMLHAHPGFQVSWFDQSAGFRYFHCEFPCFRGPPDTDPKGLRYWTTGDLLYCVCDTYMIERDFYNDVTFLSYQFPDVFQYKVLLYEHVGGYHEYCILNHPPGDCAHGNACRVHRKCMVVLRTNLLQTRVDPVVAKKKPCLDLSEIAWRQWEQAKAFQKARLVHDRTEGLDKSAKQYAQRFPQTRGDNARRSNLFCTLDETYLQDDAY
jgi:hypothetical protein